MEKKKTACQIRKDVTVEILKKKKVFPIAIKGLQ